MNKAAALLLFIIIALYSCSSSKVTTGTSTAKIDKKDPSFLLSKAAETQIDFQWFSGKAKMDYDDGKKTQNFTANIRMRRDSVIWTAITSLMGIEVARILITKDSIEILDRLHKEHIKKPFSFLQTYAPFPLDINLLQDVLIGNYLLDTMGTKKANPGNNQHIVTVENEEFKNTYVLLAENFLIAKLEMAEKGSKRSLEVEANDYQPSGPYNFSNERTVIFAADNKVTLHMKYSKLTWNEPLEFPFFISDKYE
jgi:hypothetical protein